MKHAISLLFIVLLSNYCNAQAGYDEQYMRIPHYNGNVKKAEYSMYFYTFPDKPTEKLTYEYDIQGRLLKETDWDYRYGNEVFIYKYLGRDTIIRNEFYGKPWQRGLKTVNHYNENKQLIQQDFYVLDERGIHPHAKVVNIYDTSGFLIEQQHFVNPEAEQPYSSIFYKNDSLGNRTEMSYTSPNEHRTHKTIYAYTYKPTNEIIREQELTIYEEYSDTLTRNYLYQWDDHLNWTIKTEYKAPGLGNIVLRKLTYYK